MERGLAQVKRIGDGSFICNKIEWIKRPYFIFEP